MIGCCRRDGGLASIGSLAMVDRVALFVTCLADTLFPQVGQATVTVLERLGIEVVFPLEQTCCGQMHANSGYPGEAELLARRFVEVFDGFDAIVTPSGRALRRCGSTSPACWAARIAASRRARGSSRSSSPACSGSTMSARPTRAPLRTTRPAIHCGFCAWAMHRCGSCALRRESSSSSCRTRRNAVASGARSQ